MKLQINLVLLKFIKNIELWLSAAGLIVIWAVPPLLDFDPDNLWRATAVTAMAVGVLHGIIFWTVRSRQRKMRENAIREIRLMLKDVAYNKLNTIVLSLYDPDVRNAVKEEAVEEIKSSVRDISEMVGDLSEESLTDWQKKYQQTLSALEQV